MDNSVKRIVEGRASLDLMQLPEKNKLHYNCYDNEFYEYPRT